jgi:hypothetical protein
MATIKVKIENDWRNLPVFIVCLFAFSGDGGKWSLSSY